MADTTDPQLIEAVKHFILREASRQGVMAANVEACRRFEHMYSRIIRRFCDRRRFSEEDAEDLVQRVWLQVWKYLPRFRHTGEKRKFRNWLSIITRHVVASKRREIKRRRRFQQPKSNGSLDRIVGEAPDILEELVLELERELAREILDAMQRDVSERVRYFAELLRLYYLESQTTAALANRFDKSEDNIRQDLVRARKTYQKRIAERGGDGFGTR